MCGRYARQVICQRVIKLIYFTADVRFKRCKLQLPAAHRRAKSTKNRTIAACSAHCKKFHASYVFGVYLHFTLHAGLPYKNHMAYM